MSDKHKHQDVEIFEDKDKAMDTGDNIKVDRMSADDAVDLSGLIQKVHTDLGLGKTGGDDEEEKREVHKLTPAFFAA